MSQPYIFILGTGHSGGTLLNLMLGASSKIFAAGESLHLWNLASLKREDDRTRIFWQEAIARLSSSGWPVERLTKSNVLEAGPELWRKWIDILADISPRPVVADKSNHMSIIRTLCEKQLVKPFFVHLVRDPRAVAYSYIRKGNGTLAKWRSWQVSNASISRFLEGRVDAMVLRYEDLVLDPWYHAFEILDRAGKHFEYDLRGGIRQDIKNSTLDDPIFDNVIYGGNRMRRPVNRMGQIIEPDTSYLKKVSTVDWMATTALCWPGLRRFSYPVGRSSMRRMLTQS